MLYGMEEWSFYEDEKGEMVQYLSKGMKTTNILWKLNRDYQTVERFVSDLKDRRARSDKSLLREVSVKQMNCIKSTAIKKPLLNSKQLKD